MFTFIGLFKRLHPRGCSVVLSRDNRKMGVICAHIPHHATMDETSIILADMANSAAMRQDKSCSSAWTRTKFSPTPTGAHGQRRDHLGMVHGQLDQVP